jgi:hypothetical protein
MAETSALSSRTQNRLAGFDAALTAVKKSVFGARTA